MWVLLGCLIIYALIMMYISSWYVTFPITIAIIVVMYKRHTKYVHECMERDKINKINHIQYMYSLKIKDSIEELSTSRRYYLDSDGHYLTDENDEFFSCEVTVDDSLWELECNINETENVSGHSVVLNDICRNLEIELINKIVFNMKTGNISELKKWNRCVDILYKQNNQFLNIKHINDICSSIIANSTKKTNNFEIANMSIITDKTAILYKQFINTFLKNIESSKGCYSMKTSDVEAYFKCSNMLVWYYAKASNFNQVKFDEACSYSNHFYISKIDDKYGYTSNAESADVILANIYVKTHIGGIELLQIYESYVFEWIEQMHKLNYDRICYDLSCGLKNIQLYNLEKRVLHRVINSGYALTPTIQERLSFFKENKI